MQRTSETRAKLRGEYVNHIYEMLEDVPARRAEASFGGARGLEDHLGFRAIALPPGNGARFTGEDPAGGTRVGSLLGGPLRISLAEYEKLILKV